MDFGFISTPLFCMCLDLSAPLALVIFDNHSIRKRVSCKSKGVKFSTFSTCFVDFVSSSFFIGFCDLFEAIWGSIWHHFSEKNASENRFKKRGPPTWKQRTMEDAWGSQRGRLLLFFIKADASRARCLDNNNNKVKLNSIQIELRSGWGLAEVWLELEFLLELASIAKKIQNNSKNWKGLRSMKMVNVKISKAHCSWSDTPTGPRPGEL